MDHLSSSNTLTPSGGGHCPWWNHDTASFSSLASDRQASPSCCRCTPAVSFRRAPGQGQTLPACRPAPGRLDEKEAPMEGVRKKRLEVLWKKPKPSEAEVGEGDILPSVSPIMKELVWSRSSVGGGIDSELWISFSAPIGTTPVGYVLSSLQSRLMW